MGQWPRYCLGVDPGTANVGFALLRKDSARAKPVCVALDYVGTVKGGGPVLDDDLRRLQLVLGRLLKHTEDRSTTWVVEWYTVRGRRKGGWKTCVVVGAVLGVAAALGIECSVAAPKDRANASSDKAKVIAAMRRRVVGFGDALKAWPATKHEHIADAAAHAVAVLGVLNANLYRG